MGGNVAATYEDRNQKFAGGARQCGVEAAGRKGARGPGRRPAAARPRPVARPAAFCGSGTGLRRPKGRLGATKAGKKTKYLVFDFAGGSWYTNPEDFLWERGWKVTFERQDFVCFS